MHPGDEMNGATYGVERMARMGRSPKSFRLRQASESAARYILLTTALSGAINLGGAKVLFGAMSRNVVAGRSWPASSSEPASTGVPGIDQLADFTVINQLRHAFHEAPRRVPQRARPCSSAMRESLVCRSELKCTSSRQRTPVVGILLRASRFRWESPLWRRAFCGSPGCVPGGQVCSFCALDESLSFISIDSRHSGALE